MSHLFDRFSLLWRSAGGQTANRSDIRAFDALMARHPESERRERELARFTRVLQEFDDVHDRLDDEAAVEFALWYAGPFAHRAVHDLRGGKMLEMFITKVCVYAHSAAGGRAIAKDQRFVHDLHHAVRGETTEEYIAFERDRRDARAPNESLAAYAERRIAELEALRAGERIFLTSVMRARYEVRAMQNLARAVAWLRESTNRP